MNFNAFNFLALPGGFTHALALAALLFLFAPATGRAIATDAQVAATVSLRGPCAAVATPTNPAPSRSCVTRSTFGAREGDANFFARDEARQREDGEPFEGEQGDEDFPASSVFAGFGVNAAGASRGRGTGNISVHQNTAHAARSACKRAAMAVSAAPSQEECRLWAVGLAEAHA